MTFKKLISFVLLVVLCFSLVACNKDDGNLGSNLTTEEKINNSELLYPAYNENFKYDVYTYYVKIREYIGQSNEVVVPEIIENREVLAIEENAFYKNYEDEKYDGPKITKVVLPKTIIKIANSAFLDSKYLKEIKFPSSTQIIGDDAFSGCSSLRKITIPKSVHSIGINAFANCKNLASVTIEENTPFEELEVINPAENTEGGRVIYSGAFINCPNLKAIWIPADVSSIEDGILDDFETSPNLIVYGYGQTRTAYYASENLLKFQVLNKKKFDNLSKEILKEQKTVAVDEATATTTNADETEDETETDNTTISKSVSANSKTSSTK